MRFTHKMNMHLQRVIKRLLLMTCLCSAFGAFMLGIKFAGPARHMTRNTHRRNKVQITVTRDRLSMETKKQSNTVTRNLSNMVIRNQHPVVSRNQTSMAARNQSNIVTTRQSNMTGRNQRIIVTRNQSNKKASNLSYSVTTSSENPSNYLHSDRFDLIIKMVYAYFYVYNSQVPSVFQEAYAEHIRVWNNFTENCDKMIMINSWFDGNRPCRKKRNKNDFVSSFHKTIKNLKRKGFNSSMSRIPLDKRGFLLNGAHRVAAAVILSKNATFEHHNYQHKQNSKIWGYKYFTSRGMPEMTVNVVMLEWMKMQLKLPDLNTSVSVVTVFSNNSSKDKAMRKIVSELCSKDKGIIYEREINFTKSGMRQLITHMYGQQNWLKAKIQQMLSKFNSTYTAIFLFFYAKSNIDLAQCKYEIRKLYSDKFFKSTAHIPDTGEEILILAEMILNPNSIQFMNFAKNASDCHLIAKEVASRSAIAPVSTLPGIYVGRDDVMIDSGTVLGFFGLRKRTDVDLLFFYDIDKSLLGNRRGILIQAHAFKNNSISKQRAWGDDHFSASGTRDQWDLFYDPDNFGYCYGVKFVSLKQLVRYKMKRNEWQKDTVDVDLINGLLDVTM